MIIKFLLENGADPKIEDWKGHLPIDYVDVAENMAPPYLKAECARRAHKIRELLVKNGGKKAEQMDEEAKQ